MENGAVVDKKTSKLRKPREFICHACGKKLPFCWWCSSCGFMICWDCMEENFWGMTCNGITWTCPDCGAIHGFGND
jgi:Zn-finger protein